MFVEWVLNTPINILTCAHKGHSCLDSSSNRFSPTGSACAIWLIQWISSLVNLAPLRRFDYVAPILHIILYRLCYQNKQTALSPKERTNFSPFFLFIQECTENILPLSVLPFPGAGLYSPERQHLPGEKGGALCPSWAIETVVWSLSLTYLGTDKLQESWSPWTWWLTGI